MSVSSVLRVKLSYFTSFSHQGKKTALPSCLYLPLIFIRNKSFKVFHGLSLNKFEDTAFKGDGDVSVSEIHMASV